MNPRQSHGFVNRDDGRLELPSSERARHALPDAAPAAAEAEAARSLVIRPIAPSDQAALQAGFAQLSAESRYFRFHAPMARLPDNLARYLTRVDGVDHVALVAYEREPRCETGALLGVARFVRSRQVPSSAELAITVADRARGRGLAHALLHRLASQARERGIDTFTMLVLRDNKRVRRLLQHLGATPRGSEGAVIALDIDVRQLESTNAQARVEAQRALAGPARAADC